MLELRTMTLEQAMTDGDADLVKRVHVLVAEVKRLQLLERQERARAGMERMKCRELRDSLELAKLQRDELRDEVEEQSRLRQLAVDQMGMWQGQWRELQDEHGRVLQERDAAREGSALYFTERNGLEKSYFKWRGRAKLAEARLSTLRMASERACDWFEGGESHEDVAVYMTRVRNALDSIGQVDTNKTSGMPISAAATEQVSGHETAESESIREQAHCDAIAMKFCEGGEETFDFQEEFEEMRDNLSYLIKREREAARAEHTTSHPANLLSAIDELLEAWDLNEVEVAYRRLGRAVEAVRAARVKS